jgi:hypothetical protein
MKRFVHLFMSFLIVLMATLPFTQKSEAIVGIIIKNRTTRVVGGLGAGGGMLFSTIVYNAAISSGVTGWAALQVGITAAVYVSVGLTVGMLGLVVLDDQTSNEFKFLALDESLNPAWEVKIFNQEIDQLNAIKEMIEAEVDKNPETDTANLWNHYGQLLSPETMMVARTIAQSFLNNAQVVR